MALFLSRRWRAQPQYPVEVDYGNPLAAGVKIALLPSAGFVNLATRANLSQTGSPAVESGVAGKHWQFSDASTQYITTDIATTPAVAYSVFTLLNPHAPSGASADLVLGQRTTENKGFAFYIQALGTTGLVRYRLDLVHGGVASYSLGQTPDGSAESRPLSVGLSSIVGSAARSYYNGRFVLSASIGAINSTAGAFTVGRDLFFNQWPAQFPLAALYYWDRAIHDSGMAEVQANPWQIFKPQTARIYSFPSGASSGTTVAVPKASLVLTGHAPSVLATDHKTISVPKGALTLTGYAPTVTVSSGTTVFVPKGSLTLTGYAPMVLTPQVIQVPKGGLVLTGYAPDVLTPVTVLVPKGTLTITGHAPTIVVTSNKLIEVPKGALVLRGYAPTVLGTVVAATNRGSYSESDRKLRERLRRLAIQQAHIEDDEEALAILLATIMREYR